jgi:hypothetical protein
LPTDCKAAFVGDKKKDPYGVVAGGRAGKVIENAAIEKSVYGYLHNSKGAMAAMAQKSTLLRTEGSGQVNFFRVLSL